MSAAVTHENFISKSLGMIRMRDLLCLNRWWSTKELAEELEVAPRTVQRWIAEMPEIGCMVSEQQVWGSGYRVRYRGEAMYGRIVAR